MKFRRDGSVYLLGESMGGLLSLGVALRRPDLVDRLVLVNPASSFDRSPWPSVGPLLPSLPEEIYGGVPYALAPVLFEPAALITGGLDAVARGAKASGLAVDGPFGVPVPDVAKIVANGVGGAPAVIGDSIASLVDALGSQFPTLGALTAVIPRDTLAHRLSVLAAGCEVVNAPGALRSIDVPALCVASSEDLLIPSGDEGPRLRREMRRCRVEVLEGASHAALQKDECDLLEVMAKNGFKPRAAQDPPPLSNDEGFMPPSAAELGEGLSSPSSRSEGSRRPCSSPPRRTGRSSRASTPCLWARKARPCSWWVTTRRWRRISVSLCRSSSESGGRSSGAGAPGRRGWRRTRRRQGQGGGEEEERG